ncbi:hypothetical protein D3C83_194920 [compost metagenome]
MLNDLDLAFLEQIVNDAGQLRPLMEKDPRVKALAGQMLQLYRGITAKALENEKAKK